MTEPRTCPICGAEALNAWDEIAHMEAAHPDVIAARLAAIGERPDPPRPPLLSVVLAELAIRGWRIEAGGSYIDPEGNDWSTLEAAITAQTFREIGLA